MNKKNLPIGIQEFSHFKEGNFLYIDKTELIHRIVSTRNYYFLSRPRRFGKSLLLSTMSIFQTGYLTIKKIDKKHNEYTLGYPNNEVREAFFGVHRLETRD